jgi:alkylation response protein AidB-like acyl-CoA dehydrogenase
MIHPSALPSAIGSVLDRGMVRSVDFAFSDEQIAIRNTARAFIADEVITRESDALRRERRGEPAITRAELRDLQHAARKFGFWGLSTPQEYGGMALPAVTEALLWAETGRSFIPFRFGGEADNILYHGNDEQKAEYLVPTIEGDRLSCFAITEPSAGSDAANIRTSARRDGDDWLINGEKTFITGGNDADFAIVIAVSDADKRCPRGIDRVPRRPRHGVEVPFHPDDGRRWPRFARLRRRPRAQPQCARRGRTGFRAGHGMDRPGALPDPGAGARRR